MACFTVAALGFTATSALAANNAVDKQSSGVSSERVMNNAIAMNRILAEKKVITLVEWSNNIQKIVSAKTGQEIQSIHDALYYKIMTSPL